MKAGEKFLVITALALVCSILFITFSATASAATIYIPDDYAKIQWAVNNATNGDTIIVRDGVYTENVQVSKRLTLKSENGYENCIVQAADTNADVFLVSASDVNISGFTVKNSTGSSKAGIHVYYNSRCNISGNNLLNNNVGVRLDHSFECDVVGNAVHNNEWGVVVYYSYENRVMANLVHNNSAASQHASGIYLYPASSNNLIYDNTVRDNTNGIYLWNDANDNEVFNNTVLNNSLAGVRIALSHNNTVYNCNISESYYGVYITSSSNNTIYSSDIWNNTEGVWLYGSSGNNISLNNFWQNDVYGIVTTYSSGNLIEFNDIRSSSTGIYLLNSASNTVLQNTVHDNSYGIKSYQSHNSSIYLNNFINNAANAYSFNSTDFWNSSQPVTYIYNGNQYSNYLGNYWSDYTGSDANGDGVGEQEYSINGEADMHPLVANSDNYLLLQPNQPPVAVFTFTPSQPAVDENVVFDASASYDPDGSIVSYHWDFGDGVVITTNQPEISHIYTSSGDYIVTLTVTDDGGATNTISTQISVATPSLPGDVDGNGDVNFNDLIAVLNLILSGGYDSRADVNGDGSVNFNDLIGVLNIILST